MGIKKLLLTSFMFGAIILGTTQNASANNGTDTINDDTIESLPEGVEKYYPKNPELLVDENYEDSKDLTISPYAALEQLPRSVYLSTANKSKSTSRLQLYRGDNLGMTVEPKKFGKERGTIVGMIYRNGEYYDTYVFLNTERVVTTIKTGDLSEYSLRLYCGNPNDLETGCEASGKIYPVK
ncbi:hypothetical protein ACQKOF_06400 [Lysinibacillus sp. NPDC093190]|uniref:hypothetical protein n=1 Tax=Lysinibacillus sp. NPDC093190 TaxID=3390575 RepID=UPI003D06AFD6